LHHHKSQQLVKCYMFVQERKSGIREISVRIYNICNIDAVQRPTRALT